MLRNICSFGSIRNREPSATSLFRPIRPGPQWAQLAEACLRSTRCLLSSPTCSLEGECPWLYPFLSLNDRKCIIGFQCHVDDPPFPKWNSVATNALLGLASRAIRCPKRIAEPYALQILTTNICTISSASYVFRIHLRSSGAHRY
jgi:hypothetical protein